MLDLQNMRNEGVLGDGKGHSDEMISLAPDARVVTVYHGTSIERATLAIACQEMVISRNEWDWLGDGIYFWEESPGRAIAWAKKKNGNSAAVIVTQVRLGRCLDLFDTKWATVIRAARDQLLKACSKIGSTAPANRQGNHALDRAVINYVCENLYEIDTVRGPFREGDPIFPESTLSDLTHVQIAVRNPNAIVAPLSLEFPFDRGGH